MHLHTPIKTISMRLTLAAGLLVGCFFVTQAQALSSWNPTLLVNTESFQTIDEGNGSSNIEIRFGQDLNEKLYFDRSNNRFVFTRGLLINGNTKVIGNLSGSTLNVDGRASIYGPLSASGAIATEGNLSINDDDDTNDATLTFGNHTAAQTLIYSHANQRFEFSKDLQVNGSISGATLNVDGAVTIKNITYGFPNAQGAANTYLKNDGAGGLTWAGIASGNGSGGALSLHPEFPNASYFQSGATAVGMLVAGYDTPNNENFYRWTTTQGTAQDYWIAVRVKVPKNFANWTPTPIQLRYRTATTTAAENAINLKLIDTAGVPVAITGASDLASGTADTWTTASIGGVSGGTYTPDEFITVLIKVLATSAGAADAGYLNLNWSTTTP